MIRIKEIYYKNNESRAINEKKVNLIAGFGIKGDIHGGKSGRHVSLMLETTRIKLNTIPVKGLCTSRFKENITLSGDVELKFGDLISISECEIRITQVGKRCFNDCDLIRNKIRCHLNEVFFGEVVTSGEIKIGDQVVIK